jgi:hypothetical protein
MRTKEKLVESEIHLQDGADNVLGGSHENITFYSVYTYLVDRTSSNI